MFLGGWVTCGRGSDGSENVSPSSSFIKNGKLSLASPRRRFFKEIFAGVGRLSKAFERQGWEVGCPIEAYPGGVYNEAHDVLIPAVAKALRAEAAAGWGYWHLGLVCSSFSRLNVNLNAGTRTQAAPLGDGTLAREVYGNRLVDFTVSLVRILVSRGSWFSIENPTTSLVWSIPSIKKLRRLGGGVRTIRFCQCMYGVRFPDSGPCQRCKKDTTLLTNAPLSALAVMCDGNHEHAHCIGGCKTKAGWVRRSSLAGHYPTSLCTKWARAATLGYEAEKAESTGH